MTGLKSLQQFIEENHIKMTSCKPVRKNPDILSKEGWEARHYQIKITRRDENGTYRGKCFTLYYSMGIALERKPTLPDALDVWISESYAYLSYEGFEEWAEKTGYGKDSLSGFRAYQSLSEHHKRFRNFLGEKLLEELIYDVNWS